MVRKSIIRDEPGAHVIDPKTERATSNFGDDRSSHHWDVSSEDAFEDLSISTDAVTPSSSIPSLSIRRASAVRRTSTSTRNSHEGDSTYYDVSNGSSVSGSIDDPDPRRGYPSLSAPAWNDDHESIRRTMSVPITTRGDVRDIPAPLNFKRRTYSLEDPQRAPSNIECAGNVNEAWYMENALLHGLDPNINQLQVYLLGIPKAKGHLPPAMDLPASYVVFLPGDRNGSSNASPKIARYRCRYPDCEVKWRDEDEHKIHQLEHVRVHLRCQVPQCTHPGFDNNIDLVRHLQSAHGHSHQGPFKGYACAAEVCPKKDKVWLKAETYRSHCDRAHSEDDSEDLLERSRITLGYLDFGAAVRLCQLPSG